MSILTFLESNLPSFACHAKHRTKWRTMIVGSSVGDFDCHGGSGDIRMAIPSLETSPRP